MRDADDEEAVAALVAVGVQQEDARRCVAEQYDDGERAGPAAGRDCAVLRENWTAVRAFAAMGTQWRYRPAGMGGSVPAGLDYGVVPDVLRLLGLKRKRWPVVFEQLRVMELAALEVMRAAVR